MASFIFFCTFSDYEGSSLCCGLDYVLILHLGSLIAHSPFHHKDITQKHWYSRFWGMISVGKKPCPLPMPQKFWVKTQNILSTITAITIINFIASNPDTAEEIVVLEGDEVLLPCQVRYFSYFVHYSSCTEIYLNHHWHHHHHCHYRLHHHNYLRIAFQVKTLIIDDRTKLVLWFKNNASSPFYT